jgi:uncharacterized protein (DUF1015 family)
MSSPFTKPFKGLIYNTGMTGDIATCVCPPYDVISNPKAYFQKNKYNAIRLELPVQRPSLNKYDTAKETLEKWLQNGALVHDSRETVYVYEQEFEVDGVSYLRRGFIALNRLQESRILTHEETRKKAKEDRERLIKTLKTYTSHIFGLYEDKEEKIEKILINCRKEKMYDFIDEQSIKNRFYRMESSAEMEDLAQAMADKNIYIADGHHRLAVSYRLGLSYVPIYLANMWSEGTVILPYHRVVRFKNRRKLGQILDSLKTHMSVERIPLAGEATLREGLANIARSAKLSCMIYSKDDLESLYILGADHDIPIDPDMHQSLKKLKVNVIHNGVLKGLIGVDDEEISFTQENCGSIDSVKEGGFDLALLLPPTTVAEVKDIADHGLYMPPKSTFFYPKILTGLVFYTYA